PSSSFGVSWLLVAGSFVSSEGAGGGWRPRPLPRPRCASTGRPMATTRRLPATRAWKRRRARMILRRPHEADISAAGVLRSYQHCLLAVVADAAGGSGHAVPGHPAGGGIHAPGAVQDLEGSRPAAAERLVGGAGP